MRLDPKMARFIGKQLAKRASDRRMCKQAIPGAGAAAKAVAGWFARQAPRAVVAARGAGSRIAGVGRAARNAIRGPATAAGTAAGTAASTAASGAGQAAAGAAAKRGLAGRVWGGVKGVANSGLGQMGMMMGMNSLMGGGGADYDGQGGGYYPQGGDGYQGGNVIRPNYDRQVAAPDYTWGKGASSSALELVKVAIYKMAYDPYQAPAKPNRVPTAYEVGLRNHAAAMAALSAMPAQEARAPGVSNSKPTANVGQQTMTPFGPMAFSGLPGDFGKGEPPSPEQMADINKAYAAQGGSVAGAPVSDPSEFMTSTGKDVRTLPKGTEFNQRMNEFARQQGAAAAQQRFGHKWNTGRRAQRMAKIDQLRAARGMKPKFGAPAAGARSAMGRYGKYGGLALAAMALSPNIRNALSGAWKGLTGQKGAPNSTSAGGGKAVFSPEETQMMARMGIDPVEMNAMSNVQRDIFAGNAIRRQQAENWRGIAREGRMPY